jgi:hypothetical protein
VQKTRHVPQPSLTRSFAQRLDEEAAQVYEEFVASFDGSAAPGTKAFVRGGVVEPGSRPSSEPTRACRGRRRGADAAVNRRGRLARPAWLRARAAR